jgi:hypothetical protein
MTSLFIVSLPRSLSSFVYQLSSRALGLEQPSWTTEGEIMNVDRVSCGDRRGLPALKFITRECHEELFVLSLQYLNEVTTSRCFAYKDVVQPFITAEWLNTRIADFNVLRIKRNVADVAWSMLNREWLYPSAVSTSFRARDASLIEGLIRADRRLDSVPGEVVEFDEFIYDNDVLWSALSRLYPADRITKIASDLSHNRPRILQRRSTDLYRHLSDLTVEVKQLIAQ